MDILRILFHVAKALALVGPLVAAVFVFARLQSGQKHICVTLSLVSGIATAGLFYFAALFTRSNEPWVQILFASRSQAPKHPPLHFPFPNLFDGLATTGEAKVTFLRLWNDEFSSFWTDVLNPFKMPFLRTLSEIESIPNLNGAAFFGILIIAGITSVLIAHFSNKSGTRQLKAIGVCLFIGWYFASLGAWIGPLIGGLIMTLVCLFMLSGIGRGVVVRSGDVIRVQ